MMHPKNKAERRRVKKKKEYYAKYGLDRDEHVQARLLQEQESTKEALEALRVQGNQPEPSDAG